MAIDLLLEIFYLACGFIIFGKNRNSKIDGNLRKKISFSFIIPARNEARNIPKLLESLTSQVIPEDEILVIDDESEDATASLAKQCGATVIPSSTLPTHWTGKTWALWQGAQKSKNEWLFFLDADTFFLEQGLDKLRIKISEIEERLNGKFALSLQPFHVTLAHYEQFSSFFNCVTLLASGAFSLFSTKQQGLFGPSLIISKENYFKVGGHEIVKSKVLENWYLSEIFLQHKIALFPMLGKDLLAYRMYPDGFKSLISGWTKAFATGAAKTHLLTLFLICLWITGLFTVFRLLLSSLFQLDLKNILIQFSFYSVYVLQVRWILRQLGDFKLWTSFLYPIPLTFFVGIFLKSVFTKLIGSKPDWKNRKVGAQ